MSRIIVLVLAAGATLAGLTMPDVRAGDGGLQSLRGAVPIDEMRAAPVITNERPDLPPIERNYLQQPPLIPHDIRGYKIDRRSNKCLTCHSWSTYRESGATKISLAHFRDRQGEELANVAPRCYFCTQCHVPQALAKPLVGNSFSPVDALKGD